MRWVKKRKNLKNTLVFQGIDAVVSNARIDTITGSQMPVIQTIYVMRNPREDGVTGDVIDSVQVEMDLFAANKFASDLLAAIDSAMPRRAKGAVRVPFE